MRTKLFFILFLSLFFGATLHASKRRETILLAVNPELAGDLAFLKETYSIQKGNTNCLFLERQRIHSKDLQTLEISTNNIYSLASSALLSETIPESDINFLGTTVLHYASWEYSIAIFFEELPTEAKNLKCLKETLEEALQKPRTHLTLIYKKGGFPEIFTSLQGRLIFKKLSDLKKEKQVSIKTRKSAAPSRPRQRTLSLEISPEETRWKRGERTPSPDEARSWRNREFNYRAAKLSPPSNKEEDFFDN